MTVDFNRSDFGEYLTIWTPEIHNFAERSIVSIKLVPHTFELMLLNSELNYLLIMALVRS